MKMMSMSGKFLLLTISVLSMLVPNTEAGFIAAGICYAGCSGVACACFTAAGFTMGTVPVAIIAATPALAACNTAYGGCMAACMAALAAPTP